MKHIAITKQEINGSEVNSVNSRELHKNLEVKTDYSKWATRLIEKYDFTENEDFITVVKKDGRQTLTDYIFSIDMAKEVCMVANTDKGRETRKYFIAVEKQHNKNLFSELQEQQKTTKYLVETQRELHKTQEIIGEVVSVHEKRLNNLEKNTRLENWQEKALLDAKNKKVYELARKDDKLAKKLHGNVWREFKKRFHIPRYSELTVGRYEDGLMWLENVQLHEVV